MNARNLLLAFLFIIFIMAGGFLKAEKKIAVVASIAPQEYIIEKLAGSLVEVMVMIPAGADPHTYEPKPEQVRRLSAARLYFAIGGEFEKAWLPRFRAVNPEMTVVGTHERIRRLFSDHSHDSGHKHTGDHRHWGEDPHVWLAPPLMLLMARDMAAKLMAIDPENHRLYAKNLAELSREIVDLDLELLALFAAIPENRKKMLVYHPAWAYFCLFYGLEQLAIEVEGKEPRPRDLQNLINTAKGLGLKTVFVEPGRSPRGAVVLARTIGAETVEIDPLSADWAENLRRVAHAVLASIK